MLDELFDVLHSYNVFVLKINQLFFNCIFILATSSLLIKITFLASFF